MYANNGAVHTALKSARPIACARRLRAREQSVTRTACSGRKRNTAGLARHDSDPIALCTPDAGQRKSGPEQPAEHGRQGRFFVSPRQAHCAAVSSPQELMSAKQLIVRMVEMLTKLSQQGERVKK
jgi:hypothetical protein